MLVGNTQAASITTGPRSTATFLTELISHHDAKLIPYEHEVVVFEVDYDDYANYPSCTSEKRTVTYPAIYLPGYWEVPDGAINEDTDMEISEATQCGNDTRMQSVNDFLRHFKEIFDLYDRKGLSEDTYKAVLCDMLNHLRE